jgi:hypothetical protein
LRTDPVDYVLIFGHHFIEELDVKPGHLARPCQQLIAMVNDDFAQELAHGRVGNCHVLARVQIFVAAVAIALDDPAKAQAWERESLREIAYYSGPRNTRRRIGFAAVIDRVENFVGDKLNSALRAKIVQLPHFLIGHCRVGRIVRRVHYQNF